MKVAFLISTRLSAVHETLKFSCSSLPLVWISFKEERLYQQRNSTLVLHEVSIQFYNPTL